MVGGLIMLSFPAFIGEDMLCWVGPLEWMFGEGLGCRGERVVDGKSIPAPRLRVRWRFAGS